MSPPTQTPALGVGLLLAVILKTVSSQQPQMCGGRSNASMFTLLNPTTRDCDVVLEAASSSVCGLEIDLGTLILPCPNDRLVVAGKQVCGARLIRAPFTWPETVISLRGSEEKGGLFNITVRQIECPNKMKSWCGGNLLGEHVQILSPGYPSYYPEELECRYTITASDPEVCKIEVNLQDSMLEESTDCIKDSLQINKDRLCGNMNGVRMYDISKDLNITFTTDREGSGMGFNLTARQIRCVDAPPPSMNAHLANDKQDTSLDCDPLTYSTVSRETFPVFTSQHPQLSRHPIEKYFPSRYLPPTYITNGQNIPLAYNPTYIPNVRQHLATNPYYGSQYQPNLVQFQTRPVQNYPLLGYGAPVNRIPTYQQHQFISSNRQNYPYKTYTPNVSYRPYTPPISSYQPSPFGFRQTTSQYQQCCGQVYADSHFLLVSPGFPRSTTTDCIYTITRYSTLTYQIRYQFRYFWAGEDLGTGCSGGYLEVDGSKICGCKTGTSWTSPFVESETSKTLHLKLDTVFNRLFNGFVIEVYQDDSYSQRYLRSSDYETTNNFTDSAAEKVANFSQYVETFVERVPVTSVDGYPLSDRTSSSSLYDSSRQSWSLPTDWFCLRWNLQDWLVLVREVLWAKYQCPTSSSSSYLNNFRSDVSQSDSCRTCLYLCRQNCQCCQ